jgi:Raf kinase inhibitor-like YbhB/YbcL family protein
VTAAAHRRPIEHTDAVRRTFVLTCFAVLAAAVGPAACSDEPAGSEQADQLADEDVPAELEVTSSAFDDGKPIPATFTCDGDDRAPPLTWTDPPDDAVSLAIVVDDPDAPGGTFTHWLVTQIRPDEGETVEGQSPGVQWENSFGVEAYRGPCPPPDNDAHTYRFTVYALDSDGDPCANGNDCEPSIEEVLTYIADHVTAEGVLTGTYDR